MPCQGALSVPGHLAEAICYADAARKDQKSKCNHYRVLMDVDGCCVRNAQFHPHEPLLLSFSRVAIRFLNLLCCSTRSIQAKHQVGSALICEAPQIMEERNGGWWHMVACSQLMNFSSANILHIQSEIE